MHNDELIDKIDHVMEDFIKGNLTVTEYSEYLALERIACILNQFRDSGRN